VKPTPYQTQRLLIALSFVSLVVLLTAAAALWYLTQASRPAAVPSSGGTPPPILLTPPASLAELSSRYPQIAKLLMDPSLSSAYKEFMLAYQQGGIAAAEELARERGLLTSSRAVRITLVLDSAENAPTVIAELEKFGITIEGSYGELVDIAIPMQIIEQFAKSDDPGKLFAQLSQMQHIIKLRVPISNRVDDIPDLAERRAILPSEAVTQTGALAWHKAGFTGQGIKVGVLDLGFDGYQKLLGKALPTQVTVKSFVSGKSVDQSGEVHGTACAEIIHAMAPDAELYLAYYSGSETTLGRAVEWLVEQGVHIISHSATGMAAPMDGSGSQAQLVDKIAAQGILWVNASGNYAKSHYRFTFNDPDQKGKHIFPNGSTNMPIQLPSQDARIFLNWNDWDGNATEDYDMYLYDKDGRLVAYSEESQQGLPGDRPVELIRLSRPAQKSYYLVIVARKITRPATFDLYAPDSYLTYFSPEHSLGTPADARGSLAVGAIGWNSNRLESFSSQGPTNDNRLKPDFTAPDGVTTFSYRPRVFNGTSASTPHVAGAAALVMSRYPNFKAADVAAFLQSSVVDMGPSGPDTGYGYGRLQLPSPTQAQPQPVQPKPPVIVTSQPIHIQPEPPERPGESAATSVLACLSCLVCGGAAGSLGGLTLLLITAWPRPRAPIAGPTYSAPPRPVIAPELRPQPPAPPPMTAPALVNAVGQRIPLSLGKSYVGRSRDNAIHLDDPQISRHHAEITWDGMRCMVTDLGSRNGTFVNGRRLTPNWPETLRPGDRISFGTTSVWTVLPE